jgi:hypothetical protein
MERAPAFVEVGSTEKHVWHNNIVEARSLRLGASRTPDFHRSRRTPLRVYMHCFGAWPFPRRANRV